MKTNFCGGEGQKYLYSECETFYSSKKNSRKDIFSPKKNNFPKKVNSFQKFIQAVMKNYKKLMGLVVSFDKIFILFLVFKPPS